MLDRLGYAAAALGDHDFDWSLDTLRAADARVPLSLARGQHASIGAPAGGRTGSCPSGWCDAGGLSGGGGRLHYPRDQASCCRRRGRAGSASARASWRCTTCCGEVARAPAGLTVLLAHAGGACDCGGLHRRDLRLADELRGTGVDLIVAGHTHRVLDHQRRGDPDLETGSRGRIDRRGGPGEDRRRADSTSGSASVPVDSDRGDARRALSRAVARALPAPSDSRADAGCSPSSSGRSCARAAQYPLGNLIADARRNALRADLGLVRTEAIRADLPAGPGHLRRGSPPSSRRGATSSALTVTGTQLTAAAGARTRAAARPDRPPGRRAGALRSARAAAGSGCASVRLADGRKLRADAEYTLATDDATAAGAERLHHAGRAAGRAERPARRRGRGRLPPAPAPAGRAPAAPASSRPVDERHACGSS